MNFSQENSIHKFHSYRGLLNKLLKNDQNLEVKILLNDIICNTHKLVNGEIDEDEIDHKIYSIVISLSDYDKPYTRGFFKNVDINSIERADYETLSSIITSILSDPNLT